MDVALAEDERVHFWHVDRFRELGFPVAEAEYLDFCEVDWHEMKALLAQGCSREDALEILT